MGLGGCLAPHRCLMPLSFPPRRTRAWLGQQPPQHGGARPPPWQAWQRSAPLPHCGPPPAAARQAVTEPGDGRGGHSLSPPTLSPLLCWYGQEHCPGRGQDGGHPLPLPPPCPPGPAGHLVLAGGTAPAPPPCFVPHRCCLNPPKGGDKGGARAPLAPFLPPPQCAALGLLNSFPGPSPCGQPCAGEGALGGGAGSGGPPQAGTPLLRVLCPAALGPSRSLNAS